MSKTDDECRACKGYGFLLANIDASGKLQIERCDDCNAGVTDDQATEAVFKLAQAALDLKDILVLYHNMEEDENDFTPDMRKVHAAYLLLRGKKGD